MHTLIIKLGAAGDVVRTTSLLQVLPPYIDWVTDDNNVVFLEGNKKLNSIIPWSRKNEIEGNVYDLVINLEDSIEASNLLKKIKFKNLFGAYVDGNEKLNYTENSSKWFDLSLISRFGKEKADLLKFENRRSYQEIIFEGLGMQFKGESYFIPESIETDLKGDIAIAPEAGPVWPNKKWAYYEDLAEELKKLGYKVNMLPIRKSVLEHIGDIKNHRCLVSGDTLPMHIAMGCGIRCVTLFTCTSPWEIYDYGLQKKIISPYLGEFFYKREFNLRATTTIQLEEVLHAVLKQIES
jgi:ADP-heptose:LPS heptosyltransferase